MTKQPQDSADPDAAVTGGVSVRVARRILSVITFAGAVTYLLVAQQDLDFGTMAQPGAGLFPVFAGSVLAVSAIVVFIESLPRESVRRTVPVPTGTGRSRLLLFFALVVAYAVLLAPLGHLLSTALAACLMVRLLASFPWFRSVIVGVTMAIASNVLFVEVLSVPVPRGALALQDLI